MEFFNSDGWANMPEIIEKTKTPFIVILGGRGTGKTYGFLQYCLKKELPFLYFRRTQAEIETAGSADFSPFAPLNNDFGYKILPKAVTKKSYGYYHTHVDEADKIVYDNPPVAISLALSTMATQRGFSAEKYTIGLFDEFIPEAHERQYFKFEGQAFLNAYETINRNRELKGEPPFKMVLLGNVNIADSDILDSLGLVDIVDTMRKRKKIVYETPLVTLFDLKDSPIAEKKKNTVLYQLAKNKEFVDMAINNSFAENTFEHVANKGVPIVEYKPIVIFDGLCVYQHKRELKFFVTDFCTGNPINFEDTPTEKKQFLAMFGRLEFLYSMGIVKFASYAVKKRFLKIFK